MGAIRIIIRQICIIVRSAVSVMSFCIILGICIYIYARHIEPGLLTIKNVTLTAQSLQLKKPLKIVQCSDLHVGADYDMAHLARIVNRINELEPDLIVFTGDLIDDNRHFNDAEETVRILGSLEAKLGKYAVAGNHDYGADGFERFSQIMKSSGFTLLLNKCAQINLENGRILNIIGIDDAIWGEADIAEAMKKVDSQAYNIVLCHEPDIADEVAAYPADLQLSGHTHGGQVRVPFKGAVMTPPKGHKYVKGLYSIADNERMKLYVNVGVGTSQKPFRFACLPELTLITLN